MCTVQFLDCGYTSGSRRSSIPRGEIICQPVTRPNRNSNTNRNPNPTQTLVISDIAIFVLQKGR